MERELIPKYFNAPAFADTEGMIAVGGELSVDWLLDAYGHGIFPWPVFVGETDEQVLVWWSPDPRAIIDEAAFSKSRRLIRKMRNSHWMISSNQRFAAVVEGCRCAKGRDGNTWITTEIMEAYQALHIAGHAHSLEIIEQDVLIGGIYGVAMGGMFAAESMFHRTADASKVALSILVDHLRDQGFTLIDIQLMTPHLKASGASLIERAAFLKRLQQALSLSVDFGAPEGRVCDWF